MALALDDLGYRAVGVRIDSGDLAYLSREVRSMLVNVSRNTCRPWISSMVCIGFCCVCYNILVSIFCYSSCHVSPSRGHFCTFNNLKTHLLNVIHAPKTIMASNDINEEVLYSLAEQDHSITAFGE